MAPDDPGKGAEKSATADSSGENQDRSANPTNLNINTLMNTKTNFQKDVHCSYSLSRVDLVVRRMR